MSPWTLPFRTILSNPIVSSLDRRETNDRVQSNDALHLSIVGVTVLF